MERLPMWNKEAIEFVIDILDPIKSRVFEFGSGYSTPWLGKRAFTVFSIEHDPEWYNKIKKIIPMNIILYNESRPYHKFINVFGDEWFDLVIVDGRDRLECCREGIKSVKPGGWLMLDDAGRHRYRPIREWFKDFETKICRYRGPESEGEREVSSTTIFWRKSK